MKKSSKDKLNSKMVTVNVTFDTSQVGANGEIYPDLGNYTIANGYVCVGVYCDESYCTILPYRAGYEWYFQCRKITDNSIYHSADFASPALGITTIFIKQ